MVRCRYFFLFAFTLISFSNANAKILFEGYSKVLLSGVHVGYYVNRYEYDVQKKQFISIYFLKTNEVAGSISESLKAVSTDKFDPISYQYNSISGGLTKVINATFKKGVMTAKVTEGGKKVQSIILDLKKDKDKDEKQKFLSSFLAYYLLAEPDGMTTGKKLPYSAIAEEDGKLYKGLVVVESKEEIQGIPVFKILNEFKEAKFISYATEKGEVLATLSPAQSISTELVADQKTAVGNFSLNTSSLKLLFGSVPTGQENAVSKAAAQVKTIVPSGKIQGVPGGKGLILKSKAPIQKTEEGQ
ncbi:MAG: hypothetical protein AB7O96_07300 [Pseudobdellovibrionaceae bacterium]